MKTPEINTAEDMALSAKLSRTLEKVDTVQDNITEHKQDQANPHHVTKAQVGLSDVDNTPDTDKPVSTAGRLAITEAIQEAERYTDTKTLECISACNTYTDTLKEHLPKHYHPCSLAPSSKFLDLNTCLEPGIYHPFIIEEEAGALDFETIAASLQNWPQGIKENFAGYIVYGAIYVEVTSFIIVSAGIASSMFVFQTIVVSGKVTYRRFFCIQDGAISDTPDPAWLLILSTLSYYATEENPITPRTIPQTHGRYKIHACSGANPYVSGFPTIPDTSGDVVEIFEEEENLWKYTHREHKIPKNVWYSSNSGTTWVEGAF